MPVPILSPMFLLLVAVIVTVSASVGYSFVRRRQQHLLSELAKSWRMHYSARDVFNLAPRVARHLPVQGAADVRVRDLIYGTEPGGHRYIFSADYTSGVVRSKSRRRCVVSVLEPRGPSEMSLWFSLRVAPEDRPLVEQYRSLRES